MASLAGSRLGSAVFSVGGDADMTKIVSMGHFTAIGMRTKVEEENALVINTCGQNDTDERGSFESWVWSNPTNRAIDHSYEDVEAVSTETLWQGCKIFVEGGRPNEEVLSGNWRLGKAKRPIGAWGGEGKPLLRTPGLARRAIYVPAFKNQISHWEQDPIVRSWIEEARDHKGPVFLRDFDTGRGIDRRGPLSHAWILCEYLNKGAFPG